METNRALGNMTDPGKFEQLVLSVLYMHDKKYSSIISTGINEEGKPIKYPIDGFTKVPNSDPTRFIIAQHTTTKKDDLIKKWLDDLRKSLVIAEKIRKKNPKTRFTIILTSNKLMPGEELHKIYDIGNEEDVDLDLWDQSRISTILDTTREGHYIRKKYLNIEIELLSRNHLIDLSKSSLARYQIEFFLTNPKNWVVREQIFNSIENNVANKQFTIHFFVGGSGVGKSVIAFKILQNHINSGGMGLWVNAHLMEDFRSLDLALGKALRELNPFLPLDSAQDILKIIDEGSQFLIVVDDVNRSNNPQNLIRNLLNQSKPNRNDDRGHNNGYLRRSPFQIFCPVWSNIWKFMEKSNLNWVNTIQIEVMSMDEATDAIMTVCSHTDINLTKHDCSEIANKLGCDPFLIGLFSLQLSGKKFNELNKICDNVIEDFINQCVQGLNSPLPNRFLSLEYKNTLKILSYKIMKNRNFLPLWAEIQNWLGHTPEKLDQLRHIINDGKICRENSKNQIVFRHDRLLEHFLIKTYIEKVFIDYKENRELLEEPFYIELIGEALANHPQPNKILTEIQKHSPLSLLEAVKSFGVPRNEWHHKIIKLLQDWVNSQIKHEAVLYSVLEAFHWTLFDINSPVVLQLTEKLKSMPIFLLANLRNGNVRSGINYYQKFTFGRSNLFGDKLFLQALEQAMKHHRDKILSELKEILISSSISDEERRVAFTIAGFLGSNESERGIAVCWDQVKNKQELLPSALWAAIRCCSNDTSVEFLDSLILSWSELSTPNNQDGIDPRFNIIEIIKFGLKKEINENIIRYLIDCYEHHGGLRWPIQHLLSLVDAPDALEFIVKRAAELAEEVNGTNTHYFWLDRLGDNWNPSFNGRKLSRESMDRLLFIWKNPDNNDFIRKQAFRLWRVGIGAENLDLLKAIPAESPLFEIAVWDRTRLGDYSVLTHLINFLESNPIWFDVAHNLWGKEIMGIADKYLESFENDIPTDFSGGQNNNHYSLSDLLIKIPIHHAETLLEKYWRYLKYSPLFLRVTLFIGTTTSLNLAKAAIDECPEETNIFHNIRFSFGLDLKGRTENLKKQHIEFLLPYLDKLDMLQIHDIASACERLGLRLWIQPYISDRLEDRHRKQFFPRKDELFNKLDQISEMGYPERDIIDATSAITAHVKSFLDDLYRHHISIEFTLNMIKNWLENRPTIQAQYVASAVIKIIGTRSDLAMLDQHQVEDHPELARKIKGDARFSVYRRSLI